MEIVLTKHVKDKLLKLMPLGINEDTLIKAIEKPDELLRDSETGRYVAIAYYRNLAVVYEKLGERIIVVTAIYCSKLSKLVERRRRCGRWIEL